MPPLLGLIAAALASLPGLALSYWLITGHKQPVEKAVAGFQAVALYFIPFYFVGALVFGTLLWLVLARIGQLTLPAFIVGSLVPVALALFVDMLLRGYGAGTHIAFLAFGLPAAGMGIALWAFSVRWPIGS